MRLEQRVGTMFSNVQAQPHLVHYTPPPPRPEARSLHPRPSLQIPGRLRKGGGGPAARPASPGSQSGLCLLQLGTQRSCRKPGLGRDPARKRGRCSDSGEGWAPAGEGAGALLGLLQTDCPEEVRVIWRLQSGQGLPDTQTGFRPLLQHFQH